MGIQSQIAVIASRNQSSGTLTRLINSAPTVTCSARKFFICEKYSNAFHHVMDSSQLVSYFSRRYFSVNRNVCQQAKPQTKSSSLTQSSDKGAVTLSLGEKGTYPTPISFSSSRNV